MHIAIINGPNLNKLGQREPEIYGSQTFEAYFEDLKRNHGDIGLFYHQSNHEGELVDLIQASEENANALILNAAAYTHTSIAIGDAVRTLNIPVMEVHISNVYAREPERHKSMISAAATGVIVGCGLNGYELALQHLKKLLS